MDLGDRLVPTRNRCGIIIAAILSQNNTGNFPKHKPELPKNSQEIPVSVSEATTTFPKHTTRGFMAGLLFPRNCNEHRGSQGVEPRRNDRRSPVRCSAGPHPLQGPRTLGRHSPSLALPPGSASEVSEPGEPGQGRGSSRGWETSRTKGAQLTHAQ